MYSLSSCCLILNFEKFFLVVNVDPEGPAAGAAGAAGADAAATEDPEAPEAPTDPEDPDDATVVAPGVVRTIGVGDVDLLLLGGDLLLLSGDLLLG